MVAQLVPLPRQVFLPHTHLQRVGWGEAEQKDGEEAKNRRSVVKYM